MGGFGALSLGLQHPERFGVVIGVSATDLALAVAQQPDRDVYKAVVGTPADPQLLSAINPRHLVQAGKGSDQKFVLVWGANEPTRFATGARDLTAAMRAHDLSVVTRIVPGGTHAWTTTWTLETMVWWLREAGKALAAQHSVIPATLGPS
jgi:S-formylglutathione hydrolase FrmB